MCVKLASMSSRRWRNGGNQNMGTFFIYLFLFVIWRWIAKNKIKILLTIPTFSGISPLVERDHF